VPAWKCRRGVDAVQFQHAERRAGLEVPLALGVGLALRVRIVRTTHVIVLGEDDALQLVPVRRETRGTPGLAGVEVQLGPAGVVLSGLQLLKRIRPLLERSGRGPQIVQHPANRLAQRALTLGQVLRKPIGHDLQGLPVVRQVTSRFLDRLDRLLPQPGNQRLAPRRTGGIRSAAGYLKQRPQHQGQEQGSKLHGTIHRRLSKLGGHKAGKHGGHGPANRSRLAPRDGAPVSFPRDGYLGALRRSPVPGPRRPV